MNNNTPDVTRVTLKNNDRTNINNILTTINYDITDCEAINNKTTSSSSFEVKKKGVDKVNVRTVQLPKTWQFIKCDLFDTGTAFKARHKVAITICENHKPNYFKALCNSPFRHIKRGLDKDTWEYDTHFQNIRKLYTALKQERLFPSASKCYLSNHKGQKGKHIIELSVILSQRKEDARYTLTLLYRDEWWMIPLRGGSTYLTKNQRAKNIIATGTLSQAKLTQKQGIHIDSIL